MAGLSGFQGYFGAARQTAKGTAAATPKYANPFTGGSAGPERVVERLQETDNNRDPGSAYLVRGGAAGSPELYVRPESFPIYAVGALGKIATSGAGPYTHVIDTATGKLPYFSYFKQVGGKVFERYEDCMVNSLTVRSEAGQPLTAVVNFMGLSSTISTTEWASAPTPDADDPWYYHQATVTLGGATVANVRSFEVTVENNLSQQQTDAIPLYDVVPGRRDLSFSLDMIFDDTTAYNAYKTWMYGAGTTQSSTLQTTSVLLSFANGTDTLSIDIPSAAYEEFPVDPDAGGDPVVASIRGAGIRPASGSFTTWTVINSTANAAGANYGTGVPA